MLRLSEELAWYCVCTLPKREAAASHAITAAIPAEVFAPRIIYKKKTIKGVKRFNEALFPGYIFVRCELGKHYRHLLSLTGVRGVVHYGVDVPALPDGLIDQLRKAVGGEVHEVVEEPLKPGTEVVVVEGPFANLMAVVSQVMPARDRVRILLEFLGRQIEVEVEARALFKQTDFPKSTIIS